MRTSFKGRRDFRPTVTLPPFDMGPFYPRVLCFWRLSLHNGWSLCRARARFLFRGDTRGSYERREFGRGQQGIFFLH